MFAQPDSDHPLRRLFSGLVEQVFMADVGICDVQLTEYLSDMLMDFVHVDRIYRMQDVTGEAIREVSRMEAEACLGPLVPAEDRSRVINRYIGDFTLFWTGLYPEGLRLRRVGVDRLGEYLLQGKRSYGIAGELSGQRADPPGALLRQLSEEFECCVHGLHLVRGKWQELSQEARSN